jgi:RNase P/RNase MRP subunit POP5
MSHGIEFVSCDRVFAYSLHILAEALRTCFAAGLHMVCQTTPVANQLRTICERLGAWMLAACAREAGKVAVLRLAIRLPQTGGAAACIRPYLLHAARTMISLRLATTTHNSPIILVTKQTTGSTKDAAAACMYVQQAV